MYGDENTAWRYADRAERERLEETDKSPVPEDGPQPWEHDDPR